METSTLRLVRSARTKRRAGNPYSDEQLRQPHAPL
jgi:hypothetical protein